MPWIVVVALFACDAGDPGTDPGPPPQPEPSPSETGVDDTAPPGTTPPTDCNAGVISVADAPLDMPLQRRVTVTLDTPAPAWATCSPADNPNTVLLVESDAVATTHDLDVVGLYTGVDWTCTVGGTCSGTQTSTVTFAPDPLASDVPTFTVTATEEPDTPWTLLNTKPDVNGATHVIVVDPQGQHRWIYELGTGWVLDVDTSWIGDRFLIGGGWGLLLELDDDRGLMRQVDLLGNVLLDRDLPAFGLGYNHHSEEMSDGEIVSLTASNNSLGADTWTGVGVERLDPTTETLTWSWDSQQLVDDGVEGVHNGSPWVANALEWTTDPHGEALWLSLYEGQAIWRIDPTTGARTHIFGANGTFTLQDPSGAALPAADWTYAQHDPDFTADGRMLAYDNGVGRPGGNYSRIAEYQLDLDANTATLLWSWTEPGWYTPYVGDVDYLDNGHVLITKGVVHVTTLWLFDPSAIIELDPITSEVVWRMEFDDLRIATFRAQRYGGCEIFADARHCPTVADRVAELRAL